MREMKTEDENKKYLEREKRKKEIYRNITESKRIEEYT